MKKFDEIDSMETEKSRVAVSNPYYDSQKDMYAESFNRIEELRKLSVGIRNSMLATSNPYYDSPKDSYVESFGRTGQRQKSKF